MSRAMLFLRAHTSLHAGTGATIGSIDLPIQRERHTDWPMIQGSSIKGVLRDTHRRVLMSGNERLSHEDADRDPKLTAIFGPPVELDSDEGHYAGALAVTDARILAFPVRSARGVFAWVTCQGVIQRLLGDLSVVGAPLQIDEIAVLDDHACVAPDAPVRVTLDGAARIVMEDIALDVDASQEESRSRLAQWVARNTLGGKHDGFDDPMKRLVVVHDDAFSHLVRHATEVVQRIALEYATKRVKGGALFSQEFLPPETLMYSVLLAESPRKSGSALSPDEIAKTIKDNCDGKLLQLGGDETTGKGLCWAFVRTAAEMQV